MPCCLLLSLLLRPFARLAGKRPAQDDAASFAPPARRQAPGPDFMHNLPPGLP